MTLALGQLEELRKRSGTRTVPASPEFVLEALRASYRHQCSVDLDAEPDVELAFHTTVGAWRDACNLVDTCRLADALNEDWELAIPAAEWRAVLEPPKSRTLRDVCDLIAAQASRLDVLSVGHFGASSRSAGAFLAVRSILIRAGADPALVRPSLPIADVARRFPTEFLGPISKLAPEGLPTVEVRMPLEGLGTASFCVLLLGPAGVLAAGWLGLQRGLTELGVIAAVLGAVGRPRRVIAGAHTGVGDGGQQAK